MAPVLPLFAQVPQPQPRPSAGHVAAARGLETCSGGGNWIGMLSVSRATAPRRGRSGYSLAAHQRSA